jgi:hypothetical protein
MVLVMVFLPSTNMHVLNHQQSMQIFHTKRYAYTDVKFKSVLRNGAARSHIIFFA